MADITDPQIVAWDNQRTRTLADKLTAFIAAAQAYQADYAAYGIAAKILAAGGTNNIADGYATDGRQAITGNQVINFKAAIDQLVTNATTVAVTGVGATPAAVAQAIQVNGTPR